MSDPAAGIDESLRSRLKPGTPAFVEPMLATLTEDRFSDQDWLFERKLDGVRAIAARHADGSASLWSRSRRRMDAGYPELVEALAAEDPQTFVVDGEIVAFDGAQTSFAALQPRIHLTDPRRIAASRTKIFFYLFDVLIVDGVDVTGLPLRVRKTILKSAFRFEGPVRFSQHRNADGVAYYAEACRKGWEGLIAKRADSTYASGRSKSWLKFKCVREQEFVVGGFTEPEGSRSGLGALLVGYYEGDQLRYAGKVGTGFDATALTMLTRRLEAIETSRSAFDDDVKEKTVHWVEPRLVAQIGFGEWTRHGRLRHPRYVGLRTDKDPRSVIREG